MMQHSIKTRDGESRKEIFDPVRRIWVAMTPEEEVRQKFILFLLDVKKFPLSHISVEHSISVNGTVRRYDIVVFDSELKPYILVECKAPEVPLSQEVLDQACSYNSVLNAPVVCITNGTEVRTFSAGSKTSNH